MSPLLKPPQDDSTTAHVCFFPFRAATKRRKAAEVRADMC